MSIRTETHNKNVDLIDKMKEIYKWHNGLVLEEELREFSGDDTFQFLSISEPGDYIFINKDRDFVILDNYGDLQLKDIDVSLSFIESCKSRLTRTNEMFNQFNYN